MSDIEKVALLTSDEIDNLRWRRYIDNEKGITTPYGQDVDRLLSHIAALSAARPDEWNAAIEAAANGLRKRGFGIAAGYVEILRRPAPPSHTETEEE